MDNRNNFKPTDNRNDFKPNEEYGFNDFREDQFDEEMGAEIAPPPPITETRDRPREIREDENLEGMREGAGLGLAALTLSILSLLFLPVLLGAAGIVLGFMAYRRGSRGLGMWAIGVGALSIIASFFISPFF